jgi:predicted dehydrogenase
MAKTNASTNNGGLSRREFLGSATLTTAGVVTGLTFYYTHPRPPELSAYDIEANQVRMGYIGIGNRGGSLMRSSFQVPGCIPIAVADIRETQREAFLTDMQKPEDQGCRAKKPASWKVQAYDDYRQLLDRKDIEAVTIATPHYLHAPMAIEALEAGKHVYCEKAMAYTIGENQDLAALAASKPNQIFQVGHQRRYSPIYRRVKELIDEGAIGDVVAIRAQWNQNNIERRPCPDPALEKVINWRLYSEFSGGLATEFACHQVDVANWMIGTHPDAVCGFGGVDWYRDGRDTTDNIHLVFNYKVPAKVDASGAAQEPRNVKLTYTSLMQNSHVGPSELILGTKGTIEVCLSGGGEYFVEPSAEAELEALRARERRQAPAEKSRESRGDHRGVVPQAEGGQGDRRAGESPALDEIHEAPRGRLRYGRDVHRRGRVPRRRARAACGRREESARDPARRRPGGARGRRALPACQHGPARAAHGLLERVLQRRKGLKDSRDSPAGRSPWSFSPRNRRCRQNCIPTSIEKYVASGE